MRSLSIFVACVLSSCFVTAREVPMKKAIPPLMDPIPTLPEITNRVFFEIEIEGKSVGKISFGLFGKNAPESAENFLGLAKCNKGNGKFTKKPLCLKGTKFHRIVSYFGLQGGDFTHHDGTGGESIYGGTFQSSMRELTKFNRPYMLAVAANDPSKATSQFFITTVKAQWLTGKHTIFGMVVDGWDVIDEIEKYGTYGGNPRAEVTIVNCGEEPLQEKDKEPHY